MSVDDNVLDLTVFDMCYLITYDVVQSSVTLFLIRLFNTLQVKMLSTRVLSVIVSSLLVLMITEGMYCMACTFYIYTFLHTYVYLIACNPLVYHSIFTFCIQYDMLSSLPILTKTMMSILRVSTERQKGLRKLNKHMNLTYKEQCKTYK